MTPSDTPCSMFIAENGNVTHVGWIANLYSYVEAFDEPNVKVDYVSVSTSRRNGLGVRS